MSIRIKVANMGVVIALMNMFLDVKMVVRNSHEDGRGNSQGYVKEIVKDMVIVKDETIIPMEIMGTRIIIKIFSEVECLLYESKYMRKKNQE